MERQFCEAHGRKLRGHVQDLGTHETPGAISPLPALTIQTWAACGNGSAMPTTFPEAAKAYQDTANREDK